MKRVLCILGFVAGLAPLPAQAQIPQTVSYQGVLTDASGNLVSDGAYDLTFKLYTVAIGGSPIWTETQASVPVMKGAFSVMLGSVTTLTPAFDQQYFLGIAVNGGAELTPRVALASSPYALEAKTVADSAIVGAKIANGQVVRSLNGITDQVTLVARSNISITPAAQSLTISATGGGLALPFSGTVSSAGDAFAVTNTGAGNAGHFQISNTSSPGPMAAVLGENNSTQSNARGIMGLITSAAAGNFAAGVWGANSSTGSSGFGVIGVHEGTGYGVHGEVNGSSAGVHGQFDAPTPNANAAGVLGEVPAFVTNGQGYAVKGVYSHGTAIYGVNQGLNANTYGVFGQVNSTSPAFQTAGVYGANDGTTANGIGVYGTHAGGGSGVSGTSATGTGVLGLSNGSGSGTAYGVHGQATSTSPALNTIGVFGDNQSASGLGYGVYGLHVGTGIGVRGECDTFGGKGVQGYSTSGTAVHGTTTSGIGIYGETNCTTANAMAIQGVLLNATPGQKAAAVKGEERGTGSSGIGVWGSHGGSGWGVYGSSISGIGVLGGAGSGGIGVTGTASGGGSIGVRGVGSAGAQAGSFQGDVLIAGNLSVTGSVSKGSGSFKIDHPLDPANKFLVHSFVESPDMMNVYNGNATLDGHGEATVELPSYFEALNRDFRYQLTAIGAPGPNLYVAEEVRDNRFRIAGGAPGAKVSWQVTGIRHDPVANAHRIMVEQEKVASERGRYLDPAAYGQPADKAIGFRPTSALGTPPVAKEVH